MKNSLKPFFGEEAHDIDMLELTLEDSNVPDWKKYLMLGYTRGLADKEMMGDKLQPTVT